MGHEGADTDQTPRVRRLDASLLWCAVAAVALATADRLGQTAGLRSASATAPPYLQLLAWLATLAVAAFASWRLVKAAAYAALLPLAALGFALLEPGRAGDPATWRLEWGAFGLLWTTVAVVLFRRLLRRQDELERRTHLEGTALALALAVPAAACYALFEPFLPALRAGWVASGLLVAWWLGWLLASRRYR
jgi:hypothetical protein